MKKQDEQQLSGVVAAYNVSPRGFYEGLILEVGDAGKRVQLNFAQEEPSYI